MLYGSNNGGGVYGSAAAAPNPEVYNAVVQIAEAVLVNSRVTPDAIQAVMYELSRAFNVELLPRIGRNTDARTGLIDQATLEAIVADWVSMQLRGSQGPMIGGGQPAGQMYANRPGMGGGIVSGISRRVGGPGARLPSDNIRSTQDALYADAQRKNETPHEAPVNVRGSGQSAARQAQPQAAIPKQCQIVTIGDGSGGEVKGASALNEEALELPELNEINADYATIGAVLGKSPVEKEPAYMFSVDLDIPCVSCHDARSRMVALAPKLFGQNSKPYFALITYPQLNVLPLMSGMTEKIAHDYGVKLAAKVTEVLRDTYAIEKEQGFSEDLVFEMLKKLNTIFQDNQELSRQINGFFEKKVFDRLRHHGMINYVDTVQPFAALEPQSFDALRYMCDSNFIKNDKAAVVLKGRFERNGDDFTYMVYKSLITILWNMFYPMYGHWENVPVIGTDISRLSVYKHPDAQTIVGFGMDATIIEDLVMDASQLDEEVNGGNEPESSGDVAAIAQTSVEEHLMSVRPHFVNLEASHVIITNIKNHGLPINTYGCILTSAATLAQQMLYRAITRFDSMAEVVDMILLKPGNGFAHYKVGRTADKNIMLLKTFE